ncbi:MAG: response regulator [Spirosomataceae bacterium]
MKQTIAIVDDHTLIANALAGLVNKMTDFEVAFIAEDGLQLIEKLTNGTLPDAILLDINMPNMDGFETASWLQQNYPQIPFLGLSMHSEEESIVKLISKGARGYLLKESSPLELQTALSHLLTNGYYYSQLTTNALVNIVKNPMKTDTSNPIDNLLSEKEYQFVKWCMTELKYAEIASEMAVGIRTLENYRDSVCEKLQVKSRVGIVIECLRRGILTL